ncbi:unnamed protein product [Adineta ricciae]|uniref:SH3 domain-containing protein n=1 Tax=Adineta ricciae TaxID=249248 RepID=A0A815YSI4_ADIRI|nr:unnamed protein product [Adineta ricciae]CAF1573358.1 unnamed protein product [Adineta ricciae]
MGNKCTVQLISALLIVLAILINQSSAGTVLCRRIGPANRCPADTCDPVGIVRIDHQYPSECYVIGEPHADGQQKSRKWYKITLPNGKQGFINMFYCNGDVPRCKNT